MITQGRGPSTNNTGFSHRHQWWSTHLCLTRNRQRKRSPTATGSNAVFQECQSRIISIIRQRIISKAACPSGWKTPSTATERLPGTARAGICQSSAYNVVALLRLSSPAYVAAVLFNDSAAMQVRDVLLVQCSHHAFFNAGNICLWPE